MQLGAVFDWDGVVIDSSHAHERSWELLAEEGGLPLPADHFKKGFGMKNELIIRDLLGWTQDAAEIERLSLRKEEHYRDCVRRDGIAPLPGVREFLQMLTQNSVPCVIGSSTHRLNITTTLEVLALTHVFRDIVSAEDVNRGKPEPDVFLRAAEKIGVAPEHCIVFEDAHAGIEAARRAGMHVVGVQSTHPNEDFPDADRAVQRLDALSIQDLHELISAS